MFELADLLSLHICHIALVLLILCLFRPRSGLCHFVCLIGLPAALAVALFPGSEHPAPGMTRAVLFILSHMPLVMGALHLLLAERMTLSVRTGGWFALGGVLNLPLLYGINRALDASFLYIMRAPAGTVIETLADRFGWPGYVLVMAEIALLMMALLFGADRLLTWQRDRRGTVVEEPASI